MDDPDLPRHDDVAAALRSLQLGVDAAELHGALCGFLSAHGHTTRETWITQLEIDADANAVAANPVLDQLFHASRTQLADTDLGFALLLPADDTPIAERVDALLGWCRGYLGGFGLGSSGATALSEDAEEALQDIGRIAMFTVADDEAERDEEALAEISEFVRVAALLLHADGASGGNAPGASTPKRLH